MRLAPRETRGLLAMRAAPVALLVLLALVVGCVPADEALPLGSAQFNITARGSPRELPDDRIAGGFHIRIDRFLLSFRTMTIVNLTDSEQCAYRGRGAQANVVFDGLVGTVSQAFNGIKPGPCPDVGLRLGPPDARTVIGEGATPDDLVALASGRPAHARLLATATRPARPGTTEDDETLHIDLRFETSNTSSAFGGCRDAVRGVLIRPEARYGVFVAFAAEAFFRNAISPSATLEVGPFVDADRQGNDDGVVTMDELDQLSLSSASAYSPFYQLPSGTSRGSFGDYVRAQLQFALRYGDGGVCNGIEAGTNVDL